jgi:hypothetical protein
MVTVKKISINELPLLVQISYKGDGELPNYFINNQSDYMLIVNGELFNIYELATSMKLKYYKVIYQKKPIGYFVAFENTLYSFAINIKYRKKEILSNWWKELSKTMNKGFTCYLYEKNKRAIDFLEKNRMKIIEKDEEKKIVLFKSY